MPSDNITLADLGPATGKRRVSFADETGHDLASYCLIPPREQRARSDCSRDSDYEMEIEVPTFDDNVFSLFSSSSPPSSPSSSDDDADDVTLSQWRPRDSFAEKKVEIKNVVCRLCFPQPACKFTEFMSTLDRNFVCLENVHVQDAAILCSIKVKNVSYEKSVHVRCSYDGWLTYVDIRASHVASGCSAPAHDTFSALLDSPPSTTLARRGPRAAELAVCFRPDGTSEYWDNNHGQNYRVVWSSS